MRPQLFSRSTPRQLNLWVGLPVVLTAVVGVGACSNPEPQASEETSTYAEEVAEPTEPIEAVAENPDEYIGESLTVMGEVVETYGSQAFILREEEYFAADEGLLVVMRDETTSLPSPGEYVELSGEVQQFVVTNLEKDYEIVLDDSVIQEIEATYAEAPFLLVNEVKYSQESDNSEAQ